MDAKAVILQDPRHLTISALPLAVAGAADVVVDVRYSGISSGTERLLWNGRMPQFPGMGYPLVPGYESVGRVVEAGADSGCVPGQAVFVPGAACFGSVRGLFGATASRLVVPGARVQPIGEHMGEQGVLLALAATAYHAVAGSPPGLIVGHGVLGRLAARIAIALGHPAPTVWEQNLRRMDAVGYSVMSPDDDTRRDYDVICDLSGDANILDSLIGRIAARGEIVLAGFYAERMSFGFPPAFMREARIRVAAQWQKEDLAAVVRLVDRGLLSLDRLITDRMPASRAPDAYRTAFEDTDCLKMILQWRD